MGFLGYANVGADRARLTCKLKLAAMQTAASIHAMGGAMAYYYKYYIEWYHFVTVY